MQPRAAAEEKQHSLVRPAPSQTPVTCGRTPTATHVTVTHMYTITIATDLIISRRDNFAADLRSAVSRRGTMIGQQICLGNCFTGRTLKLGLFELRVPIIWLASGARLDLHPTRG